METGLSYDLSKLFALSLLHEEPRHGYELIRLTGEKLGRRLSPGTLYPFMKQLNRQGLIRAEVEWVGKKKRKVYVLTEKGRQFSENMFKRVGELLESALEPSLHKCSHCGSRVYGEAYHTRINGKLYAFCCKYCAADFKATFGGE